MLGHMQKINHFWTQINKPKMSGLDVFAQSPSILIPW